MIQWRTTPNGVLYAPVRGQAPACPSGFEPIPGNDWAFYPEIVCQYREMQKLKIGCCNTTYSYYCRRDSKHQLQSTCRKCHDRG